MDTHQVDFLFVKYSWKNSVSLALLNSNALVVQMLLDAPLVLEKPNPQRFGSSFTKAAVNRLQQLHREVDALNSSGLTSRLLLAMRHTETTWKLLSNRCVSCTILLLWMNYPTVWTYHRQCDCSLTHQPVPAHQLLQPSAFSPF